MIGEAGGGWVRRLTAFHLTVETPLSREIPCVSCFTVICKAGVVTVRSITPCDDTLIRLLACVLPSMLFGSARISKRSATPFDITLVRPLSSVRPTMFR